jgi:lysophospholipase L1-like esterase
MDYNRRNFLTRTAVGAAALTVIPTIVSSAMAGEKKNSQNLISGNGIILFQGDSITDSGREKRQELPNNASSFGNGYALMIAANLLNKYSDKNLTIYNRGISGNKVYQLADRWQKDCLDLKPTVMSILIGVNDYWHKRNGQYDGTPEVYENDFRKLLTRTKEALPDIKLIICQPFVLTGTTAVDESWLEPFKAYQEIAAKIAEEFKTVWVPFQKVFTEATKHAPAKYWTDDGVHPSMAGSQLMAEAWLKATGF